MTAKAVKGKASCLCDLYVGLRTCSSDFLYFLSLRLVSVLTPMVTVEQASADILV